MSLASVALLASALAGWVDVTVQPSRSDRAGASFQKSLAALDRPSERTLDTLRRLDLDRLYRKNADRAFEALVKAARGAPDPEVVYALAELSWIEGKRLDRWRKPAALGKYVDAAAYAYDFLFEPELAAGRNPSDPRYRLACDLYNGGLDRLIRFAQSKGEVTPEQTLTLKVHGEEQTLRVSLQRSAWSPSDVDQIILASDFEVTGLSTRSYQYGLGVPLIGIHHSDPANEAEKFFPPEMAFPLTAFLRPNSRLRDPAPGGHRDCTLELVDPVAVHKVGTTPAEFPVEADMSTPLAYMWSRTDLNRYRWSGLFRPGAAMGRANLMLLRPYEPGKIPVVMVHGLVSSPLAWVPMINELLHDPALRDRYQFLLYMYPTGVPVPIAAAGLRDALTQAQQAYDPDGRDPAFERMVLLGHSMGGLLSHAMSVDSGDRFWQLNSDRRFAEIAGEPEILAELERYLFFKPLPFVKRVVFLATPHRGSVFSRNVIGRVGSNLIAEPDHLSDLLAHLIKRNPDAFDAKAFRRLPTSIDTLDTDSSVLKALLAMEAGPGVSYHSIIGALRPGPIETRTDGVVPYTSSHLEKAETEIVVRSDHSVQKDPEAVLEVRRILYRHAGLNAAPAPTPAATAGPTALPARR